MSKSNGRRVALIVVLGIVAAVAAVAVVALIPSQPPGPLVVQTQWPGYAADMVEAKITRRVEYAVTALEGAQRTLSISRDGASTVVVWFAPDAPDESALDEQIAQLKKDLAYDLPDDVELSIRTDAPVKTEPVVLVFSGGDWAAIEAAVAAVHVRVSDVPGVKTVAATGVIEQMIRLMLDDEKLLARGIAPQVVGSALSERVFFRATSQPGRYTRVVHPRQVASRRDWASKLETILIERPRVAAVSATAPAIALPEQVTVPLSELATVSTVTDRRHRLRADGQQAVMLLIQPQDGQSAAVTASVDQLLAAEGSGVLKDVQCHRLAGLPAAVVQDE